MTRPERGDGVAGSERGDSAPGPEREDGVPGPERDGGSPALVAVDHVQLAAPAGSEDALRRFYAGVLGMTELAKPAALAGRGGCWFASGDVVLHLGVETPFRPARKAHPGLRVTGLDAYAARLRAAGAPVTWDDALMPDCRRLYTEDPPGNRLELLEPRD